ncbi:hypothetical protein BaRGS_00039297 [Batillaria attramentaria]|uniref:Uncharacterized protein n=1 Tax=Batillaria attramentaria TaxID=370345 RepID=A0ABD0J447_9CAEN
MDDPSLPSSGLGVASLLPVSATDVQGQADGSALQERQFRLMGRPLRLLSGFWILGQIGWRVVREFLFTLPAPSRYA